MTGYKRVRLIRTLEDAVPAEERPRCGNCHKRLTPETAVFELGASPETPAQPGDLPRWPGGSPKPYKAVLGINSQERSGVVKGQVVGTTSFYAHVWTGEFIGYNRHRASTPIFCTQVCAARFGCLCFEAGHRRKGAKS